MPAPLQRIGGAAASHWSASLPASLAMPAASRWCSSSSSRISTLLGGSHHHHHLLLRRPRVCRQPFAAAALFSTAARAPAAGAIPPRGSPHRQEKRPSPMEVQQMVQRIKQSSGSAFPPPPPIWGTDAELTDPPRCPGAKFGEDVDALVATLKRTHQFDRSAVSAVLPLLARTRQWETAVELVELMPRHGHVPPSPPHTHFPSLPPSSPKR